MIKKIIRKINGYLFMCRTKSKFRPRILGKVYVENKNVNIGKNNVLYNNVKFWGNGSIILGNNVKIGDNTMIYSSINGGVFIGDNTIIAANSYIIDMDHGIKKDMLISEQEPNVSAVYIGSDCWLGEDVTVIKGARLGDGCIVGAKSLINKQFESYKVIAGIPAKVIKERK